MINIMLDLLFEASNNKKYEIDDIKNGVVYM